MLQTIRCWRGSAPATEARAGRAEKKAKEAAEEYAKFWGNFGAVLKEGLYEDHEQRESCCRWPLPLDGGRRARLARPTISAA